MKKFIGVVLVFVFLLVGCGKKTETMVCTLDNSPVPIVNTYTYEGDKIIVETSDFSMLMKDSEMSKEEMKVSLDDLKKAYNDIKGTKFTYTIKKDTIRMIATIDYSKANIKELAAANLTEAKQPSLKETLRQSKNVGFKCK